MKRQDKNLDKDLNGRHISDPADKELKTMDWT